MSLEREPGSFKDPSGHVYYQAERVFRTVMPCAAKDFEAVKSSGLFDTLVERKKLIPYRVVAQKTLPDVDQFQPNGTTPSLILEHPRIPFISYPYEWCFYALRDAALLQLELYLAALDRDVMLSDATAYNIQFQGTSPVFIDHLSFRPYRSNEKGKGEVWGAHQQFCDQFLNPLLLRFLSRIPYNSWYRGSIEGIPTVELNRLIPFTKKFSWHVFVNVVLQAKLLNASHKRGDKSDDKAAKISFKKDKLVFILKSMKTFVEKLESPAPVENSVWEEYMDKHNYQDDEEKTKRTFIADFAQHVKPKLLCDLGCNVGDYAALTLRNGAEAVIGLDFDVMAVEKAYLKAKRERLDFLPLCMDMTNPSSRQGWDGAERKSLKERMKADALIALALVHHLAIGKNVPLNWVVSTITRFAPTGVIEFVPKTDPMVQKLLLLRDDIFPDYTREAFETLLDREAKIIKTTVTSQSGRRLYWYAKH